MGTAAMTEPTAVEKIRMALAEMGYGGVGIFTKPCDLRGCDISPHISMSRREVPAAVAWMALEVGADHRPGCFPCWLSANTTGDRLTNLNCRKGHCAHPDLPRNPPRELLVKP